MFCAWKPKQRDGLCCDRGSTGLPKGPPYVVLPQLRTIATVSSVLYYIRCTRLRAQSIQSTAYFSRFLWGNWVGDPVLQECDLRSCWQCKLIYDRPLVACSFVMLFVLSTHALWPFSFALPETTDRFINKVLFASIFRHGFGGLMEYARQFFYLRTIYILFAHRSRWVLFHPLRFNRNKNLIPFVNLSKTYNLSSFLRHITRRNASYVKHRCYIYRLNKLLDNKQDIELKSMEH